MTVQVTTPSDANAHEFAPGARMNQLFGNGNKEHPAHCGIGSMEAGVSVTFDTPGYGFMIVLEGDAQIEDEATLGQVKALKPGDVVHWEKGSLAKYTSITSSRVFCTISTPLGDLDVGVVSSEGHH
ncbi:hypothetical protein CTheo_8708 [Ceratobasidium theobromae]|uniref:Uncharacterized protein n=1 Tax=Ceratobasidium theobromae TaxID=1582974 RepID=A0A5N5Q7V3_9AGAM|nr:hypothetical protein CTheo_8708 [Ceratobasidium theobromae]